MDNNNMEGILEKKIGKWKTKFASHSLIISYQSSHYCSDVLIYYYQYIIVKTSSIYNTFTYIWPINRLAFTISTGISNMLCEWVGVIRSLYVKKATVCHFFWPSGQLLQQNCAFAIDRWTKTPLSLIIYTDIRIIQNYTEIKPYLKCMNRVRNVILG